MGGAYRPRGKAWRSGKPRGLDLAGLRHRAPPSPIICLSNTTQPPPLSVVLDSKVWHRRRSCVVLDLLPASGAGPCLLAPKSSLPAGGGGAPEQRNEGPPKDGPRVCTTALRSFMRQVSFLGTSWRSGPERREEYANFHPFFCRARGRALAEDSKRGSGEEVQDNGEERKRGSLIPAMEKAIGDTAGREREREKRRKQRSRRGKEEM